MIGHINKQLGTHALYRGGGSIGLLAACRSGSLIARDPRSPDRRVLAQVKSNLTAPQPSLAYDVVPQPNGPPRLTWQGPSVWTAGQLLAAAQEEDLSKRTLDGAKKLLAIRSQRVREQTIFRDWWLLPGQQLHPEAGTPDQPDDELMRFLAEQEKKFLRACPLDDDWESSSGDD